MSDAFHFRFSQVDAQRAVSDFLVRTRLAHAVGYAELDRVERGWSRAVLLSMGYRYEPMTQYWVPSWWPEWAE